MRWPWSVHRPCPSADADAAAAQAQRALRDTNLLADRADEVADELDAIRRRNHFGLAVTRAIRRD